MLVEKILSIPVYYCIGINYILMLLHVYILCKPLNAHLKPGGSGSVPGVVLIVAHVWVW